ncbi:hypothetical protein SUGI_0268200 [Cryptomeria japonica]|nr:hypothetical protein SUGI_0268200 [Cryptomeria japonica]
MAIIYVGGEFNALPSKLVDIIVAHSPFDSFMVYFGDVLPEYFYYSPGVFGSTIVGVERNTVKYLSTWEDKCEGSGEKSDGDPEECERATTSAPWPMVPKPWLINEHHWKTDCVGYGNGLVVVDEEGSISHKDAMSMIVRWGIKAYPFSKSRGEELRKAEWKDYFKLNSQSGMDFIFQHCEFFQLREKEVINCGQIIFLCVGKIDKMLEFLP